MSTSILRVASRDSNLALWQTHVVMEKLESLGHGCTLIPLKTIGDIDLVNPIYAMGVQGVFTRELDVALLSNKADIAVHSLKDIPTVLPKGLLLAAILERASHADILIHKEDFSPSNDQPAVIATSSIRRKSQWLQRFPRHSLVNVRGNVETRIRKFEEEGWDGIIFAKAGLERLGLLPSTFLTLDWMIPAPAQGAMAVVCREEDAPAYEICRKINHPFTELRVLIERDFLFHLEGGCSVPISVLAQGHNEIKFTGAVHSLDGAQSLIVCLQSHHKNAQGLGKLAAEQIKADPKGKIILDEYRKLNRFNAVL